MSDLIIPIYTTGVTAVVKRITEGREHYVVLSHLGFDVCWSDSLDKAIKLAHAKRDRLAKIYHNIGYTGEHVPQFTEETK